MSQEPFGDIPLFREIHRILASSQGPVNLEIARQVGSAVATEGAAEPAIHPSIAGGFSDAVRAWQPVLSGYTRLPLEEPAQVAAVTRKRWLETTLDSWRWLLERLATRFASELAGPADQQLSSQMGLQTLLGQVTPLLFGMQAGTLVGRLARESLGRYDWPIPRDDDGRLLVVPTNAERVSKDYGFEIDRFVSWLALRESSRHLVEQSAPWVGRYFRNLLIDVVDAIEVDRGELERRLSELQAESMESLAASLGPEDVIPLVPTERHRVALARMRAFTAVFEGYAQHAHAAVSSQLLGDTAQIEEGMARRELAASDARKVLGTLLGLSRDVALDAAGTTFCNAVTSLHGISALNRVWGAPDNLPSIDEIVDPFSWIERVLQE